MCQDAEAMACRVSYVVSVLHGIRQVWGGLDDSLGERAGGMLYPYMMWRAYSTQVTMAGVSNPTLCRVG